MRVMIFFDLPVVTAVQRKRYRQFRRSLIKEGFLMIQESVYVRIASNESAARLLEQRVASFTPREGIVQSLIITEKQYTGIRFLVGSSSEDVRNSNERTIVI